MKGISQGWFTLPKRVKARVSRNATRKSCAPRRSRKQGAGGINLTTGGERRKKLFYLRAAGVRRAQRKEGEAEITSGRQGI